MSVLYVFGFKQGNFVTEQFDLCVCCTLRLSCRAGSESRSKLLKVEKLPSVKAVSGSRLVDRASEKVNEQWALVYLIHVTYINVVCFHTCSFIYVPHRPRSGNPK